MFVKLGLKPLQTFEEVGNQFFVDTHEEGPGNREGVTFLLRSCAISSRKNKIDLAHRVFVLRHLRSFLVLPMFGGLILVSTGKLGLFTLDLGEWTESPKLIGGLFICNLTQNLGLVSGKTKDVEIGNLKDVGLVSGKPKRKRGSTRVEVSLLGSEDLRGIANRTRNSCTLLSIEDDNQTSFCMFSRIGCLVTLDLSMVFCGLALDMKTVLIVRMRGSSTSLCEALLLSHDEQYGDESLASNVMYALQDLFVDFGPRKPVKGGSVPYGYPFEGFIRACESLEFSKTSKLCGCLFVLEMGLISLDLFKKNSHLPAGWMVSKLMGCYLLNYVGKEKDFIVVLVLSMIGVQTFAEKGRKLLFLAGIRLFKDGAVSPFVINGVLASSMDGERSITVEGCLFDKMSARTVAQLAKVSVVLILLDDVFQHYLCIRVSPDLLEFVSFWDGIVSSVFDKPIELDFMIQNMGFFNGNCNVTGAGVLARMDTSDLQLISQERDVLNNEYHYHLSIYLRTYGVGDIIICVCCLFLEGKSDVDHLIGSTLVSMKSSGHFAKRRNEMEFGILRMHPQIDEGMNEVVRILLAVLLNIGNVMVLQVTEECIADVMVMYNMEVGQRFQSAGYNGVQYLSEKVDSEVKSAVVKMNVGLSRVNPTNGLRSCVTKKQQEEKYHMGFVVIVAGMRPDVLEGVLQRSGLKFISAENDSSLVTAKVKWYSTVGSNVVDGANQTQEIEVVAKWGPRGQKMLILGELCYQENIGDHNLEGQSELANWVTTNRPRLTLVQGNVQNVLLDFIEVLLHIRIEPLGGEGPGLWSSTDCDIVIRLSVY